jgi:hypothetical protein
MFGTKVLFDVGFGDVFDEEHLLEDLFAKAVEVEGFVKRTDYLEIFFV